LLSTGDGYKISINQLQSSHYSGHHDFHKATEEEGDQAIPGKIYLEKEQVTVDSRIQGQLEEDGGGS